MALVKFVENVFQSGALKYSIDDVVDLSDPELSFALAKGWAVADSGKAASSAAAKNADAPVQAKKAASTGK